MYSSYLQHLDWDHILHLYQNVILECVGVGKTNKAQFKLHPKDINTESYWNFNIRFVVKDVAAPLSSINCNCKQPWYFGHTNTCAWAIAKSLKDSDEI